MFIIDDFDADALVKSFADAPHTALKRAREIMCVGHYDAEYGVSSIYSIYFVFSSTEVTSFF